jgi:hypothetical protein
MVPTNAKEKANKKFPARIAWNVNFVLTSTHLE